MEFGELLTFVSIAVTIFIGWKLYMILGQKTGHQGPPSNMSAREEMGQQSTGDNVVDLPGASARRSSPEDADAATNTMLKEHAKPDSDLFTSLKAIVDADQNFNPDQFIQGAKSAYEMIVTAFNDGDTKALKGLLAKDVFEGFSAAIAERNSNGERMDFSFVGINDARIVDAEVVKNDTFLSLRFTSQIISAKLDAEDEVVDGDLSEIVDVTDIWTFARDSRSRDPNWKLVATEAET